MASIEADLQRTIDRFEKEIASLTRSKENHEAALAALGGSRRAGTATRTRSASSGANGSRRRGARTRTRRGQRRDQVLKHLEKNPESRPSEIASAIKASPSQVSSLLRKLRDDKLVTKSGKGYRLRAAAKS
jgi:DNA-binding transcriptional ArsR family regulator